MRLLHLTLALTLSLTVSSLTAQQIKLPYHSQEEIANHLMIWVPPIYPTLAQAAQVQGDVVVKVEIAPDGLVRSTKIVSGPPMLRQATSDAVKGWRYQPFYEANSAIAVVGNVLVSFTLGDKPAVHTLHEEMASGSYSTNLTFPHPTTRSKPDEQFAEGYNMAWDTCSRGVIAHVADTRTAAACKEAAVIADEFPGNARYIERRRTYVYAAIAFANVRDLNTALPYANKAVDVVKLGHDDSSGCEAAYSIRGQIRAFSGDMKGGDKDMSMAEDCARKVKNSKLLKGDLQFHAELLSRMNKPQEAQSKLDEASKL